MVEHVRCRLNAELFADPRGVVVAKLVRMPAAKLTMLLSPSTLLGLLFGRELVDRPFDLVWVGMGFQTRSRNGTPIGARCVMIAGRVHRAEVGITAPLDLGL